MAAKLRLALNPPGYQAGGAHPFSCAPVYGCRPGHLARALTG